MPTYSMTRRPAPWIRLIERTDHVDVRIISSLARLVEVAVEGNVSSVPAYRCPGLCPIGPVRAAAMMRQAHAGAQSVPDDDFPGVESPPRHVCRIVVAPIGRTWAASAVVHGMGDPVFRLRVPHANVAGVSYVLDAVVKAERQRVGREVEQTPTVVAGAAVARRSLAPDRRSHHVT